jgi:hypothetical protein
MKVGGKEMNGLVDYTYMKKEAVSMRPTATVRTASAGYQATGTGLEIAACIVSAV